MLCDILTLYRGGTGGRQRRLVGATVRKESAHTAQQEVMMKTGRTLLASLQALCLNPAALKAVQIEGTTGLGELNHVLCNPGGDS
jgi:hypothetical protein